MLEATYPANMDYKIVGNNEYVSVEVTTDTAPTEDVVLRIGAMGCPSDRDVKEPTNYEIYSKKIAIMTMEAGAKYAFVRIHPSRLPRHTRIALINDNALPGMVNVAVV